MKVYRCSLPQNALEHCPTFSRWVWNTVTPQPSLTSVPTEKPRRVSPNIEGKIWLAVECARRSQDLYWKHWESFILRPVVPEFVV